jgi:predicted Zn-dependent protease
MNQTPGKVSDPEAVKPTCTLSEVQSLYDRNLFQQAYKATSAYWSPATRHLSSDELVLALRLAARLGGLRLSRWLGRTAMKRYGDHASVRYYTSHIAGKGWRLFNDLRSLEANPELEGGDPATQASWLASSAVRWAAVRDFDRAHDCIRRARDWKEESSWVASCESDVLGMQDRWAEALTSAELSWEMCPGTPYAARTLAGSLLNLRRVREAAERLALASETSESLELPLLASWYLGALAETYSGEDRKRTLENASKLADRLPGLAPLADRETRALFARARLDIAELANDHDTMERWAEEARSPFHRKVLKNLRRNPAGARIRLPFRHAVQKHNECLPTSIGSAMAAMGLDIDVDAMAADITFGGTSEWAAGEWLEKEGFVVRFFNATPEISARLINAGFPFVVTLEHESGSHAVAMVGLDEAAGTLIVHDPQSFRSTEYLLEALGRREAPLGPRAMLAVPPHRAPVLDQLLETADAEVMAAREAHRRAEVLHGRSRARQLAEELAVRHPSHPGTRLVQALQAHQDGHIGASLAQFQNLLKEFPGSSLVRSNLVACCRSLGNVALMRETLADVVERGILPGIESQKDWVYPPAPYVTEYADLLGSSAQTSDAAENMLHALLRRQGTFAPAWHVLADILWTKRDTQGALLGYRISAYLEDRNEHYALAYCNALGRIGREEEGLEWLSQRVRRFGVSSHAVVTWVTWITALEQWGRPERALAAAGESLARHSDSAELLAFLVPFFARMGQWTEAEQHLSRLESAGNTALFRQASAAFHRMRGELAKAVENAEAWLLEAPLSMRVRHELIDILARRDKAASVVELAGRWCKEHPAHDEIEEVYCRQLEHLGYSSWRKYSVILRRVKRNPEDGWAWRELAFCAIYDFERAGEKRQRRLAPRISYFLDQCSRLAPQDPTTLRAYAQWAEARGEWGEAVDRWLEAIERDPTNTYACHHAWDCSARLDHEKRHAVWMRLEAALLGEPGRSRAAREMLMLAAHRFGIAVAEEAASRWSQARPDDPELAEAHAQLLLRRGHGHTDYQRALELLSTALQRFPYQAGLRFSQASALRKLRRLHEAEEALQEIIRRHPDNSSARVQLAWVSHRHGRPEEALRQLEAAATHDPQNASLLQAQIELLIEAKRPAEARETVHRLMQWFSEDDGCRASAVQLMIRCGSPEDAVQIARQGVAHRPRSASLWLVLGQTLNELRQFAARGEIESCLRRSLELNQSLYEAADYLAMLLTEQRRYQEAEDILLRIAQRLGDRSPAQGRAAWIHRAQGRKREALDEMISVVQGSPWYEWGWRVLMDWILEDKSWDNARSLLTQVPPEVRTNTQIRQRRLEVLERAGTPANVLDDEWKLLLHDFPEEMSLHLLRYDSLRDGERWAEAAEVLNTIHTVHPDSPFVLARLVEVLCRAKRKDETIDMLMRIFFPSTESSNWPAEFAWEAVRKSNYEEDAYQRALILLNQGERPPERTLSLLAAHAMQRGKSVKLSRQPLFQSWFPDRGAREVLDLLRIVGTHPRKAEIPRGSLLRQLSDFGYQRVVRRYWKKHKEEIDGEIGAWAEAARSLTALRRRREARALIGGWRQRQGVAMWIVANYVVCCSGLSGRDLREIRASCRDALAGLPHDHCARYLVFRLAEACALLGDEDGFGETRKRYDNYFDGKLEDHEFFEVKRRYLLADLPGMARDLENKDRHSYRRKVWSLRWECLSSRLRYPASNGRINILRWWWLILLILWVLSQLLRNDQ